MSLLAALAVPAPAVLAAPPRTFAINETLRIDGAPADDVPATEPAIAAPDLDRTDDAEGGRSAGIHQAVDPDTAAPARSPGATSLATFDEDRALGTPRGPILDAAVAATSESPGLLASLDPRHGEIGRVVAALAVVVALIFATRLIMRRAAGVLSGGPRPSGVLDVLARYPISRGQSLLLLKMGQRIVLLHQGQSGIRALTEVSDPGEVASLLGRMEAGARADEARQFRHALEEFEADHDRIAVDPARGEIIDLTRAPRRPRRALFGRRAVG